MINLLDDPLTINIDGGALHIDAISNFLRPGSESYAEWFALLKDK